MTTLKVTVDNKKNARLLKKVLQNMRFVKKIEEEPDVDANQYTNLKRFFDEIKPNYLFQNITNPVKWQKEIRDEWEAS